MAALALREAGLMRPENRMDWWWDLGRRDNKRAAGAPMKEMGILAAAASRVSEGSEDGGVPAVDEFLDGVLSSGIAHGIGE